MLQKRPAWLDVVEAYPPLPPPTLPPSRRTGRSRDIQYPQDELRKYAAVVLINAHPTMHTYTIQYVHTYNTCTHIQYITWCKF